MNFAVTNVEAYVINGDDAGKRLSNIRKANGRNACITSSGSIHAKRCEGASGDAPSPFGQGFSPSLPYIPWDTAAY